MTTRLIASRSIACAKAARTRWSLNGFLPEPGMSSSSSRHWSMPRKMVRSSGPWRTSTLASASSRRTSWSGTGYIRSISPESSAATRVASLAIGVNTARSRLSVRLRLVPPLLVRLQHDPVVLHPLDQLERAGAVGVGIGEVGLAGALDDLEGVVGLHVFLIDDVEVRHVEQQDRVRPLGLDLDRVVVDLAQVLDRGEGERHLRARLGLALEGVDDVVGIEGVAIVELDALAELEGPGHAVVAALPLGRQIRLERQVGQAMQQAPVDVALHGVGRTLVVGVRVQAQDVAGGRVAEHLLLRRGGQREQSGGADRSHQTDPDTHDASPCCVRLALVRAPSLGSGRPRSLLDRREGHRRPGRSATLWDRR